MKRILCVTPMYPEPENPAFGWFVEQLNRALERYAGIEVDVVRRPAGQRGLPSYAQLLRQGITRMRSGTRYDLVVGHYLAASAGVALALARLYRTPLVLTAHGSDVAAANGHLVEAKAGIQTVTGKENGGGGNGKDRW